MADDGIYPSRAKRKAERPAFSDDEVSITEEIKKVRISTTPGLLRAHKDVKDFNGMFELHNCPAELKTLHGEEAILCVLNDLPMWCPNVFRIAIPRFYPHHRPVVHCMCQKTGGWQSRHISVDSGERIHPDLEHNWLATMTLANVVAVIAKIAHECEEKGSSTGIGSLQDHDQSCPMSHDESTLLPLDLSSYQKMPDSLYNETDCEEDDDNGVVAMEEDGNFG